MTFLFYKTAFFSLSSSSVCLFVCLNSCTLYKQIFLQISTPLLLFPVSSYAAIAVEKEGRKRNEASLLSQEINPTKPLNKKKRKEITENRPPPLSSVFVSQGKQPNTAHITTYSLLQSKETLHPQTLFVRIRAIQSFFTISYLERPFDPPLAEIGSQSFINSIKSTHRDRISAFGRSNIGPQLFV